MGNLQQQCRGITNNHLELDCRDAVYAPNEIVSGTVTCFKQTQASVVLTGIIYFKKRKKTRLEKSRITFFSSELNLFVNANKKENFQLQLDDHLPPSFNDRDTYPNISYSVNLIYNKSREQIHSSIPIRVCPRVHIDRPLLLAPFFFGPIENQNTNMKLEVKINRAVFNFDDIIQIYYELQNPQQEYIHKMEFSLGIYCTVESNVWQNDICNGIENFNNIASKNKLIRNKVLLNIPNKIYLPPTFKFQYGREGEQSSFNLMIEYKIQFKIYLDSEDTLWQVDIPIVLCNETIEQKEHGEGETNCKSDLIVQPLDMNVNFVE